MSPDNSEKTSPASSGATKEIGLVMSVCLATLSLWVVATLGGVQLSRWKTPQTPLPLAPYHPRLAAMQAGPVLSLDSAVRGRDLFVQACVTCHGADGFGRPGLGKSLVHSDFVADGNDAVLVQFIAKGREANDPSNTTKVAMPPRGGNPDLTDEDLRHVVVYMRGLQDPRRMPTLPAMVADTAPSAAQQASALAAAGGDKELAGYIASGDKLFHSSCIACHGKGGVGIAGNGKALANNEFVRSLDDDSLLAFIKQGRSPTDPKSSTGIQMPPKGGNPAMSDDDILDVIAYLRTLQGTKPGTPGGK